MVVIKSKLLTCPTRPFGSSLRSLSSPFSHAPPPPFYVPAAQSLCHFFGGTSLFSRSCVCSSSLFDIVTLALSPSSILTSPEKPSLTLPATSDLRNPVLRSTVTLAILHSCVSSAFSLPAASSRGQELFFLSSARLPSPW